MYMRTTGGQAQRAAAYQKLGVQSEVESASPHRLIQLLIDGALGKIAVARGAMQRGDTATKGRHISWAISIVDGLRGSLNMDAGGKVAENLAALYAYMNEQLLLANLHDDVERLDEVSALLAEIRAGWVGIGEARASAPSAA